MTKLIIDIGNTFSKLAVYESKNLKTVEVSENLLLDDVISFFQRKGPFRAAILSSVTDYSPDIAAFLKQKTNFFELSHKLSLPVSIHYKTPRTLGKDRIAAVVGAAARFPAQEILVIDAGTAITYDMVTAQKTYLGGGISPGIDMRFKALHTFTGNLPLVPRQDLAELLGDSTTDSILSGVLNGVLAEVSGIIDAYRKKFDGIQVIITGGDHKYFDNKLKNNIFALPNLVLDGLNEILDLNVE